MLKKLKKGLKKAAKAAIPVGAAILAAKAMKRDKGALTSDMPRDMVPMKRRMVQGLNFPAGTNLSGMNEIAARGSIDDKNDYYKKGGRVGVGKAKRGFGRAMKKGRR